MKKFITFWFLMSSVFVVRSQQPGVAINTDGSAPHASDMPCGNLFFSWNTLIN